MGMTQSQKVEERKEFLERGGLRKGSLRGIDKMMRMEKGESDWKEDC